LRRRRSVGGGKGPPHAFAHDGSSGWPGLKMSVGCPRNPTPGRFGGPAKGRPGRGTTSSSETSPGSKASIWREAGANLLSNGPPCSTKPLRHAARAGQEGESVLCGPVQDVLSISTGRGVYPGNGGEEKKNPALRPICRLSVFNFFVPAAVGRRLEKTDFTPAAGRIRTEVDRAGAHEPARTPHDELSIWAEYDLHRRQPGTSE